MHEIADGLYRMLIKFEVIDKDPNATVIFMCACGVMGLLAILVDVAVFTLRRRSPLGLKHTAQNTLLFVLAWSFGAMIIGYFAEVARIFQVTLLASATVGFAWPVVFTELLQRYNKSEPEQTTTEEA